MPSTPRAAWQFSDLVDVRVRVRCRVRAVEQSGDERRHRRAHRPSVVSDRERGEHRHPERIGRPCVLDRLTNVGRAGALGQHDAVGRRAQRAPATSALGRRRAPAADRPVAASSATSRIVNTDPSNVTVSPCRSRRTIVIASSRVVSGDGVRAPICSIHSCTPCRCPASSRPGASCASVAISIAVIAGLRATAGRMPIPTVNVSVRASAVAARLIPAV